MRKAVFALFLFLCILSLPHKVQAQGGFYRDISLSWNGVNLIPNVGAQVTICASGAVGNPCAPAITIYGNAALTVTQTNPITTGTDGSWSLYLAPGQYSYTVTGTGLNPQGPFLFTVPMPSGQTPLVAEVNLTGQNNNIGTTTLYAVPASGGGMYRGSCYIVETTAPGTSGTTPSCSITYTDLDSSTPSTVPLLAGVSGSPPPVGTIDLPGTGIFTWNVKASTNIQYQTTGYASNAANALQYAIHIRLEYLGP